MIFFDWKKLIVLIDLLHLVHLLVGALNLLERRQVRIALVLGIVDGEAELDHAVDAPSELGRLLEGKAGRQQRGVEEEPDQILDGLVGLVGVALRLELGHNRVLGVDLHGLLGDHVRRHRGVAEGLGLHDALHVGGPAELGSDEGTRGVGEARGDLDLLDLLAEHLLDKGDKDS